MINNTRQSNGDLCFRIGGWPSIVYTRQTSVGAFPLPNAHSESTPAILCFPFIAQIISSELLKIHVVAIYLYDPTIPAAFRRSCASEFQLTRPAWFSPFSSLIPTTAALKIPDLFRALLPGFDAIILLFGAISFLTIKTNQNCRQLTLRPFHAFWNTSAKLSWRSSSVQYWFSHLKAAQ